MKKWLSMFVVVSCLLSACSEKQTQEITSIVTDKVVDAAIDSIKAKANNPESLGCEDYDNCTPVNIEGVIDGDTIVISGLALASEGIQKGDSVKVRLLLVDAPELKDDDTKKPQPYAEDSRDRVKELLSNAKTIAIEFDEGDKKDKYDRLLGYIYFDGIRLQDVLVEEGLARVAYVYPPNTRHLSELEQAESIAISEGVGVWGN